MIQEPLESAMTARLAERFLEDTEQWGAQRWNERLQQSLTLSKEGRPDLRFVFPSVAWPNLDTSELNLESLDPGKGLFEWPQTLWEGLGSYEQWLETSCWARAALNPVLFVRLFQGLKSKPAEFWMAPPPFKGPRDPWGEALDLIPTAADCWLPVWRVFLESGYRPRPADGRMHEFLVIDEEEIIGVALRHGLDPKSKDGQGRSWLEAALEHHSIHNVVQLVLHDPALAKEPASQGGTLFYDTLKELSSWDDPWDLRPELQNRVQQALKKLQASRRQEQLEESFRPVPVGERQRL